MKLRTTLAGAAVASISLLGVAAPFSHAADSCGTTGPTRTTDASGNPDGKDTITSLPDGGQVYQSGSAGSSGVVGVAGPNGYIEAGGASSKTPPSGGIQGSNPQTGLSGSISGSSVCVAGTHAP